MSDRERFGLDALSRVKCGELTVVAAAELIGLSLHQARRLWKRFKPWGTRGPCTRPAVRADGNHRRRRQRDVCAVYGAETTRAAFDVFRKLGARLTRLHGRQYTYADVHVWLRAPPRKHA